MRIITLLFATLIVVVIVLASHATHVADAAIGGTFDEVYPASTFWCLASKWSFMVTRAFGDGRVDRSAPINLNNALLALFGRSMRDVYVSPCRSQSPEKQIQETLLFLGQGLDYFNKAWIVVSRASDAGAPKACLWSATDPHANCEFLRRMVSAGRAMSAEMGVFSSANDWTDIVGANCSLAGGKGQLHLWYVGTTNATSFDDFKPFGGWTTPTMKQFPSSGRRNSSRAEPCGVHEVGGAVSWMPI